MWRLVAQCPCNDGGGALDEFVALVVAAGVIGLVKWIGFVRKWKGASGMRKVAKIGVVAALLVLVGIVIVLKSSGSRSGAGSTHQPLAGEDENQAKLPRLVDVGAGQCIPCKMMAPILEDLKQEFAGRLRVEVYDLTVDRSAQDRFGVRIIPTQVFYDPAGHELWRHEGLMSKDDILAKWKELGIDLSAGTSTQPEPEGGSHEAE